MSDSFSKVKMEGYFIDTAHDLYYITRTQARISLVLKVP